MSNAYMMTGHRGSQIEAAVHAYAKQFCEFLPSERSNEFLFLCGGALGADMAFAEAVVEWNPHSLWLALPFPNHDERWPKSEQLRLRKLMKLAGKTTVVSAHFSNYAYHVRNHFMLENSCFCFGFWDGRTTGGTFACLMEANRRKLPWINALPQVLGALKLA